ncbi:MAG: hypothetical protein ACI9OJ_004225 [Myxococcota bacterium]|jgi:hypothetical protein
MTGRPVLSTMMMPVLLMLLLVMATSGCELEAGEWLVGDSLIDTKLVLTSLDQGIHPSKTVLDNPNNPFRFSAPGAETKWTILDSGGNAAAFYSWATLLAIQPNGENQFYAASMLKAIVDNGEVSSIEEPFVRDMAAQGFQALLDHFPDAVTFDASGTIPFELATPAVKGLIALGVAPRGWTLVTKAAGGEIAVPVGPNVIPDEAGE